MALANKNKYKYKYKKKNISSINTTPIGSRLVKQRLSATLNAKYTTLVVLTKKNQKQKKTHKILREYNSKERRKRLCETKS